MSLTVLQWNIKGYINNYIDLQLLLKKYKPKVISLQETHICKNQNVPIPINYQLYTSTHPHNSFGGSAILIHNSLQHQRLNNSPNNFDIVNVTIQSKIKFTISSIYISPNTPFTSKNLNDLFPPSRIPMLITGDFNSWHTSWGSNKSNYRGNTISKFLIKSMLTLLNDGSPTHYSTHHTFTHIDLSISSPILALQHEWKIESNLFGSDHFPILITLFPTQPTESSISKPNFNLSKANWQQFQLLAERQSDARPFSKNVNKEAANIQKIILQSANESIPQILKTRKHSVPWWNTTLQELKQKRNQMWNKLKRNISNENIIEYKKAQAMFRRKLKICKRESINTLTSNINPSLPPAKVWSTIRTFCGLKRNPTIHCLDTKIPNQPAITDKTVIANEFGQYWSNQAQNDEFSATFRQSKQKALTQNHILNPSKSATFIETKISYIELELALNKLNGKTPGFDRISYPMIKNLPIKVKLRLIEHYNNVFNNYIPQIYKNSLVIPILKPNSDKTSIKSYRPISLNPCCSKVLDKIIANRLWWFVTSDKLLHSHQMGFRKGKSVSDFLVYLDYQITQSLSTKKHLSIISLDFAKAFDKIGVHTILDQLKRWNIGPKIFQYVKNYMNNRNIKIRITSHYSRTFSLQNGIPQGSPLSVILFLIAYNELCNIISLHKQLDFLAYADDFIIIKKMNKNKRVSFYIDDLYKDICNWCKHSGAELSLEKCKQIHFCRKHNCSSNVTCNNFTISTVDNLRILGLVFNKKYKWNSHIEHLTAALTKRLDIIKCLSNHKYNCNTVSLISAVKSLIISKLNYGLYLYAYCPKSITNKLNSIINSSIRIALGAYRTTPVRNLYLEANIFPLNINKEFATAKLCKSLILKDHSPLPTLLSKLTHSKLAKTPSCLNRIVKVSQQFEIPLNSKLLEKPVSPHWMLTNSIINTELSTHKKTTTPPATYKQKFYAIKASLKDFKFLFTDGSKINSNSSYSIVQNNKIIQIAHLPLYSSNFSAELIAIHEAVKYAAKLPHKHAICTDSLSSLKAIANPDTNNFYTNSIRNMLLKKQNKLKLIWVPGHAQIPGNELADSAAKHALKAPLSTTPNLLFSDIKKELTTHFKKIHTYSSNQSSQWYKNTTQIAKSINCYLKHDPNILTRRDQIKILRLRLGHTKLTHQHLIDNTNPSNTCKYCNQHPINTQHILDTCTFFANYRKSLHNIKPTNLLNDPSKQNIIKLTQYLKYCHLYNEI